MEDKIYEIIKSVPNKTASTADLVEALALNANDNMDMRKLESALKKLISFNRIICDRDNLGFQFGSQPFINNRTFSIIE